MACCEQCVYVEMTTGRPHTCCPPAGTETVSGQGEPSGARARALAVGARMDVLRRRFLDTLRDVEDAPRDTVSDIFRRRFASQVQVYLAWYRAMRFDRAREEPEVSFMVSAFAEELALWREQARGDGAPLRSELWRQREGTVSGQFGTEEGITAEEELALWRALFASDLAELFESDGVEEEWLEPEPEPEAEEEPRGRVALRFPGYVRPEPKRRPKRAAPAPRRRRRRPVGRKRRPPPAGRRRPRYGEVVPDISQPFSSGAAMADLCGPMRAGCRGCRGCAGRPEGSPCPSPDVVSGAGEWVQTERVLGLRQHEIVEPGDAWTAQLRRGLGTSRTGCHIPPPPAQGLIGGTMDLFAEMSRVPVVSGQGEQEPTIWTRTAAQGRLDYVDARWDDLARAVRAASAAGVPDVPDEWKANFSATLARWNAFYAESSEFSVSRAAAGPWGYSALAGQAENWLRRLMQWREQFVAFGGEVAGPDPELMEPSEFGLDLGTFGQQTTGIVTTLAVLAGLIALIFMVK